MPLSVMCIYGFGVIRTTNTDLFPKCVFCEITMTGYRTFILSVRDLMCDSKEVSCAVGAYVVSPLLLQILVLITVNGSSE